MTSGVAEEEKEEIRHTDSYEFREELKRQRTVLEGVLRQLGGGPAARTGEAQ